MNPVIPADRKKLIIISCFIQIPVTFGYLPALLQIDQCIICQFPHRHTVINPRLILYRKYGKLNPKCLLLHDITRLRQKLRIFPSASKRNCRRKIRILFLQIFCSEHLFPIKKNSIKQIRKPRIIPPELLRLYIRFSHYIVLTSIILIFIFNATIKSSILLTRFILFYKYFVVLICNKYIIGSRNCKYIKSIFNF